MSYTPNQPLLANGLNFTPTIHNDTYGLISPSRASHAHHRVLITGASKGIGRATALSFARSGCAAIALAARSPLHALEAEIQAAAQEAGKPAPRTLSVPLDVTDPGSVDAAAKSVEKEFGGLDVLVNNAGYLEPFANVGDSDPAEWWRVFEVNVKGPYLVTRALLPLLLKGGEKTIVNVSSIGAHFVGQGGSGYQTTKLALLRFTEFVQAEYGEQGVLAYAIHPGGVETELALGMPQERHGVLIDQVDLAADTMCWLTQERREWLAGRYVSATWDMGELVGKKDEILEKDLLKVRMAVV